MNDNNDSLNTPVDDEYLDGIIKMIVSGDDTLRTPFSREFDKPDIMEMSIEKEEILGRKDSQCELIPIKDFIDFNFSNIAFDITGVDRGLLLDKLKHDDVYRLYELEDAKYITIWTCGLQGFECDRDIYFDGLVETYKMAELVYQNGSWYYRIIDDEIPND